MQLCGECATMNVNHLNQIDAMRTVPFTPAAPAHKAVPPKAPPPGVRAPQGEEETRAFVRAFTLAEAYGSGTASQALRRAPFGGFAVKVDNYPTRRYTGRCPGCGHQGRFNTQGTNQFGLKLRCTMCDRRVLDLEERLCNGLLNRDCTGTWQV